MTPFHSHAARFGFRAILALLFLVIPLTVAWLGFAGLPRPFTQQVGRALSGQEYEVRIARIRLNLLRGPVALGIEVRDREKNLLLQIDRLAVALNLSELLQKQVRVEALELNRANLRVPMGGGNNLRMEDVTARILLPPGRLRIPSAEGNVEGIHFSLSANILHPLAFDPARVAGKQAAAADDSPSPSSSQAITKRLLAELRTLEFADAPPQVRLQISGDFADLRSISVESAGLVARRTRWREAEFDALNMVAKYRNGIITLEDFFLRNGNDALHAAGTFSDRTGAAEIFVRGKFDPVPWLRSLGKTKEIREFDLRTAPWVDLHITRTDQRSPWRLLGSATVEDFSFRGVPVDFVGADFAWNGSEFLTRAAKIDAPSIHALLDARLRDGVLSLRARGTFDPTRCKPWLDQGMQRVVSLMELADPAKASVELEIPLADSGALHGTGFLELGRTAMRGAWIEGGRADLVLRNRAVEYHNIALQMQGGTGTGTFVYDFGRREVRLRDIVSSVPPGQILLWVDPKIAEAISPYRWKRPPNVRCDGTVDMADAEKTRLDLRIEAPAGLDYDLLGKELSFSDVRGTVQVRGRSLTANVTQAKLFGGSVQLQTVVSLDSRNPTYRLSTSLRGVDFASINRLYFDYTGSEGELSADFSYEAEFARQTELVGKGWVRVENGNVFAIPVLGPLSSLISGIIPGVGYETSRLATADFTVANQTIQTNNLEIVGSGFSLYGEGKIHFVANDLNLNVRLNARGTPGIVLLPVSKLFEYVGTGPVGNPKWRPRNLPREMTPEGFLETVTSPVRQLLGESGQQFPANADSSPNQGNNNRSRRKFR